MRGGRWWWVLVLLGMGWLGMAVSAEPDPEAVRRLMEKYEREAAEEAAKKAPVPKPRPKPAPAPKPASKPAPKAQPTPTVNYDHEAWKSAERCGTAACFEAYLEEYPKGRYARMARARLKSAAPPSKTPVVATPVPLEKSSPKSSDLNMVPIPKGCFETDSKKKSWSGSEKVWSSIDDRACEF